LFKSSISHRIYTKKDIVYLQMDRDGWWQGKPAQVYRNGKNNNDFWVIDGHNRIHIAKQLKIPVKYVVEPRFISVKEIETNTNWTNNDHMEKFVAEGDSEYLYLKKYHDRTGIGVTQCVSLLSGLAVYSAKLIDRFKDGEFEVINADFALFVEMVVLTAKRYVDFASNTQFVSALAKILLIDGIDHERLIKKIKKHSFLLKRQYTKKDYLDVIESVYNRQTADKVPISFLAEQHANKRSGKQ